MTVISVTNAGQRPWLGYLVDFDDGGDPVKFEMREAAQGAIDARRGFAASFSTVVWRTPW